jgi:hypothetical protein
MRIKDTFHWRTDDRPGFAHIERDAPIVVVYPTGGKCGRQMQTALFQMVRAKKANDKKATGGWPSPFVLPISSNKEWRVGGRL